ncbi:major facilitator superfamily domain-containing protein [Talaromyces proteolyticus]|uniref:Major facilitator superfamily domain-containing protein n=1 Tax=Talaromyces proteolyticus TaxID=1131652 RepID=A0AAD4KKY7_9EURO|nr:major facilitator superfamily domain-containing protein [Talaromyces proteolyticus]KAH8690793.1 major facilitator superfamily domain-containing protein [Talaromyces proteolyticus]
MGKTSWASLPRKDQLFLLFLCRLFDFMQIATFQTVCYYQLKSFDLTLPETTLSWQTGIAIGAFTAAQICTSVLWGSCADKDWCGRKPVLLIGLFGTAISCLGSAFAQSFYQMVLFRVIGGLLNGTVGIVRTMLSEVIVEKRFQSRAFSLLSLSFNVASFLGPLVAGALSGPPEVDPTLQNSESRWLQRYPYALPSLVSAGTMFVLGVVVLNFTEETAKHLQPTGSMRAKIQSLIRGFGWQLGKPSGQEYSPLMQEASDDIADATEFREINSPISEDPSSSNRQPQRKPQQKSVSIWTFSFIMTLLSQAIFDFHMGAFTALWPLFLSSPRTQISDGGSETHAGGGLGMPIMGVGVAASILGAIGMVIQIFVYPRIHDLMGTVKSYRYFSLLFPIAYFAFPFIRAIRIETGIWIAIIFILFIHVTGRVFVIPATLMVLNNSAPHPMLLGKVHGIGQTTSAAFRTLGPFFAGYLYEFGLRVDSVIIPWWIIAGLGIMGSAAAQFVRDGAVPVAVVVDHEE